jgi:hypothetical protein
MPGTVTAAAGSRFGMPSVLIIAAVPFMLCVQDDTAIGIDGGLPSADAYWEGIGRCAVGPRTLR